MKDQVEIWKRVSSKEIADCRVFKVREDFCERVSDGARYNFFVTENPDWVNVIALTNDKQIILIEQYRQGIGEITLEIPGGMLDEGEDPKETARRELSEETGYEAGELVYLGKSRPNPALQTNWMHHYLAIDCIKTHETAFDEHESIIVKLSPIATINNLIKDGEITHSLALAAFTLFYLNQDEIFIKQNRAASEI